LARRTATAVLSGLVMLAVACGEGNQRVSTDATPAGESSTDLAPGERVGLPKPPVDEREHRAIDLQGSHLLVFGGYTLEDGTIVNTDDGAVLDVASREWRRLPRAPFSAAQFGPLIVGTGSEWIVVGQPCARLAAALEAAECPPEYEAAAYDPTQDAWRELADPSYQASGGTPGSLIEHGWTGTEAVFSDGETLFLYTPESDDWRDVALPAGSDGASVCVVDGEVFLAVVQDLGDDEPLSGPSPEPIRSWALASASAEWRELPPQTKPIPADELGVESLTCVDNQLIYVAARRAEGPGIVDDGVLWFDARAQRWAAVPEPGLTFGPLLAASATSDGTRLLWPHAVAGSDILRLEAGSDAWTRIPKPEPPDASPVDAEGDVFVLEEVPVDGADELALYRAATASP
jgi:hypothetical protein